MKPAPKVAFFIFSPLGRVFREQRPGPERTFHGQSQRPNLLAFLAAVAEGDTWTRTRIGVAALPILVIEARRRWGRKLAFAILVFVVLFGLSVGMGLIFRYI
jgi:hypothetical protein